jgi:hypothetical protein
MMAIQIAGSCKFRIFGITLGTVPIAWVIPLPAAATPLAGLMIGQQLATYNERGVSLTATVAQR